jgi:hypothetical protein
MPHNHFVIGIVAAMARRATARCYKSVGGVNSIAGRRLLIHVPGSRRSSYNRQVPARMHHDLLYALIISFAGAALFLLVDRYEPNHTMAALLKFLVLALSSLVIMQRMGANWLSLF